MNALENLLGQLGPDTISRMAARLGATPQQTQSAVAAALPALVAGLARNASQPQGAQALGTSPLDKNHAPNLMDSLGPLAGTLLASQMGGGNGGGMGGLLRGLLGGALGGAPQQQAPQAGGLGGLRA